ERQLGPPLAVRTAEVRGDDETAPALEREAERGEGGLDARPVADPSLLERHVQVGAQEDPPAPELQVAEGPHEPTPTRGCGQPAAPRRACGSRIPTRCRTRRGPCRRCRRARA